MITLPCMGKKGSALFQITADGAYENIPEEVFLRRHYPLRMLRGDIAYTEEQLLDELLHPRAGESGHYVGNRIWFLYGAPGSGKSEASKWLSIKLKQAAVDRPVIRVTKDELDTMHVLDRLQKEMGGQGFDAATTQRWQEFREKVETLADLLAIRALFRVLPNNPPTVLRSGLTEAVKQNLGIMFQRMEHAELGDDWVPQLIAGSELDLLKQSVAAAGFPINWDDNLLHTELLRAWHSEVHGKEIDWGLTLRKFAEQLPPGTRPILMIDDVMRALNIFAVELLEAFLNHFDTGRWDVLVGVTPGALEQSLQGQQLHNRIKTGTYSQRITHLRLTSDTGQESYFVTADNAPDFMARYMMEYKDMNGWRCGAECSHYDTCRDLQCGQADDARLAPFTPALVRRLFRSVPDQEGKARAIVKRTGEILNEWTAGGISPRLLTQYRVSPTFWAVMAEESERLRPFLQLFGPQPERVGNLPIPSGFWSFFNMEGPAEVEISQLTPFDIEATAVDTLPGPVPRPQVQELPMVTESEIMRWLGRQVENPQSLQLLREGINKLVVQHVVEPHVLTRDHVLRSKGSLTYRSAYQSQIPPVRLEAADEHGEGIQVPITLRDKAFKIAAYGNNPSPDKVLPLLEGSELAPVLYSAVDLRSEYRAKVQDALKGRSLAGFALDLMVLLVGIHGPVNPTPTMITRAVPYAKVSKRTFPHGLEPLQPRISDAIQATIHQFFKDTYMLRDDLVDAFLLSEELAALGGVHEVLRRLDGIDTVGMWDHAYLGQAKNSPQKLKEVVAALKEGCIKALTRLVDSGAITESLERFQRNATALADVNPERIGTWQTFLKQVAKALPHLSVTIGKVTEYDVARFADHKQKAKELIQQTKRLQGDTGKPTDALALVNTLYLISDLADNPLYRLVDLVYELLGKVHTHITAEMNQLEAALQKTGVPLLSTDLLRLAVLAKAAAYAIKPVRPEAQALASHLQGLGYAAEVTVFGVVVQEPSGLSWVIDFRPDLKRGLTPVALRRMIGYHQRAMERGANIVLWLGGALDNTVKEFVQHQYPGRLAVFGSGAFGSGKVFDSTGHGFIRELASIFLGQLGASWQAEYEPLLRSAAAVEGLRTASVEPSIRTLFQETKKGFDQYEQVGRRQSELEAIPRVVSLSRSKAALWAVALDDAIAGQDNPRVAELANRFAQVGLYLAELGVTSLEASIKSGSDQMQVLQAELFNLQEQSVRSNALGTWRERLENLDSILVWDVFGPLVPMPRQALQATLGTLKGLDYSRPGDLSFVGPWMQIRQQLLGHKADGDLASRLKAQFSLTGPELRILDEAFVRQRGLSLSQLDVGVIESLESKLPGIKNALVVVAKAAIGRRS